MIRVNLGNLPGTTVPLSLIFDKEEVAVWISGGEFSPKQSAALATVCRAAGANIAPLEYRCWTEPGFAIGARADEERVHLYYEKDGLTRAIAFVPRSDISEAAALIETARERALELVEWRVGPKPAAQYYPLVVPPGETIDLVH